MPIVGNDTVTEVDANMQGRAGYLAQRGQTMLECDVVLDEQRYVDWIADQRFKAMYYQVAPAGKGWAIHMPECFSAEPPELVHEGSLKYKLRLRATINEGGATDSARAKFVAARF